LKIYKTVAQDIVYTINKIMKKKTPDYTPDTARIFVRNKSEQDTKWLSHTGTPGLN